MLLKGDFDVMLFVTTSILWTMMVPLVLIVISVGFLSGSETGAKPSCVMLSMLRIWEVQGSNLNQKRDILTEFL